MVVRKRVGWRRVGFVAAFLVSGIAAELTPALRAACAAPRVLRSTGPAGTSFLYTPGSPFTPGGDFPYAPYGGSTTYYIQGRFWSFGSGDPAAGAGIDSGSATGYSRAFATDYGLAAWLGGGYYGGHAAFLGGPDGDWQAPGVDGCITEDGSDPLAADPEECLVVLLGDLVPGEGYFAALSAPPDDAGVFDFSPAGGFPPVIALAPVPRPTIVAAGGFDQVGAIDLTLTVDPGPTSFGNEGFYLQCHAEELLVGYKLYMRNWVPGDEPSPVFDNRALERWQMVPGPVPELPEWQELTPEVVPLGEQVELTATCPLGGLIAVAASLHFGGTQPGAATWELPYLSGNSSMIDCGLGEFGAGRVSADLALARAATPGDLELSWGPSCSPAADDYAIYEGQLGDWYGHSLLDCDDNGADRVEQVTPSGGDRYYLVVPLRPDREGSYGLDSAGQQRPVGLGRCRDAQLYGPCSP